MLQCQQAGSTRWAVGRTFGWGNSALANRVQFPQNMCKSWLRWLPSTTHHPDGRDWSISGARCWCAWTYGSRVSEKLCFKEWGRLCSRRTLDINSWLHRCACMYVADINLWLHRWTCMCVQPLPDRCRYTDTQARHSSWTVNSIQAVFPLCLFPSTRSLSPFPGSSPSLLYSQVSVWAQAYQGFVVWLTCSGFRLGGKKCAKTLLRHVSN